MGKSTQLNYTPTPGYLIAEPLEVTRAKGWELDEDQTPQLAKVLKVGKDGRHVSGQNILPPCKSGDTILHSFSGFEKVNIEDKEYRVVPFEKVLLVKDK